MRRYLRGHQKVTFWILEADSPERYTVHVTSGQPLHRTLTTEYTFIRYVPSREPEGSSRTEMRQDPERASGKHPPGMQDGILQGDETRKGS